MLVAGNGADNLSKQTGGWSITWQGTENTNADFPGATSVLAGIRATVTKAGGTVVHDANGEFSKKPDVAIVVFGEEPYAEGAGNVKTIDYVSPGDADLQLLKKLRAAGVPVVAVFLTGRPLWVESGVECVRCVRRRMVAGHRRRWRCRRDVPQRRRQGGSRLHRQAVVLVAAARWRSSVSIATIASTSHCSRMASG